MLLRPSTSGKLHGGFFCYVLSISHIGELWYKEKFVAKGLN